MSWSGNWQEINISLDACHIVINLHAKLSMEALLTVYCAVKAFLTLARENLVVQLQKLPYAIMAKSKRLQMKWIAQEEGFVTGKFHVN